MTNTKVLGVGAVVGFLGCAGIYFAPDEPYQHFIVVSGTLNGVLTALLITMAVTRASSVWRAVSVGAGFGMLMGLVVFLAKGGWVSWDARYVVPTTLIEGAILGLLVRWMSPAPPEG